MSSVQGHAAENTGWSSEICFVSGGEASGGVVPSRAVRRKRARLKALIGRLFSRAGKAATAETAVAPLRREHDSAQGRIYPLVVAARRASRQRAPQV